MFAGISSISFPRSAWERTPWDAGRPQADIEMLQSLVPVREVRCDAERRNDGTRVLDGTDGRTWVG